MKQAKKRNELNKLIASKIIEAREKGNISLSELSTLTGIDKTRLFRIETGFDCTVSEFLILSVFLFYGTTTNKILGFGSQFYNNQIAIKEAAEINKKAFKVKV